MTSAVPCPACGKRTPTMRPVLAVYRTGLWEVCACGALYERATGRHVGRVTEAADPRKPPVFEPLSGRKRRLRYYGFGKFRIERR